MPYHTTDNPLTRYFAKVDQLSEEEIASITEGMDVKTYPKGTVLLREDEVANLTYFVMKGCVRQYYLVDGEERTNYFFTENQWVLSLKSMMSQTPANVFWVCEEETELVNGDEEREQKIFNKHPRFEGIARKVLELIIAEHQELLAEYAVDNAEQRYQRLMARRPDLLQRVPQYQIASYIGIKPESLSRIRKRLTPKY